MTALSKILDKIDSLDLSEPELDLISSAIHAKRHNLRKARAAQLVSGCRCRLINIKPKYMTGVTGTLETRQGAKWLFRPDPNQDTGRFDSARPILIPDTALEPIND